MLFSTVLFFQETWFIRKRAADTTDILAAVKKFFEQKKPKTSKTDHES